MGTENMNNSTEILSILKDMTKKFMYITIGALIALVLSNAIWIWYFYQYDYSVDANGIYTMVDSNGNIISQDIDSETWDKFMEWKELNGEDKSGKN